MSRRTRSWMRAVKKELSALGESRHAAKKIARMEGANTPHEIAQKTGIHGKRTMELYQKTARNFFEFCEEQFGIKRLTDIEGQHAAAWLLTKVDEKVKYSSFKTYAAALNKIALGISRSVSDGQKRDWYSDIQKVKNNARSSLDREYIPRGYDAPKKIVESISKSDHRLVAELQLFAGARLSEAIRVRSTGAPQDGGIQLLEENRISIKGKGGRIRKIEVPSTLYKKLNEHIKASVELRVDARKYLYDLKKAVLRNNEKWTGNASHALRWAFAQNHFADLQSSGLGYEASLLEVSRLLGHNRPDITLWYLR